MGISAVTTPVIDYLYTKIGHAVWAKYNSNKFDPTASIEIQDNSRDIEAEYLTDQKNLEDQKRANDYAAIQQAFKQLKINQGSAATPIGTETWFMYMGGFITYPIATINITSSHNSFSTLLTGYSTASSLASKTAKLGLKEFIKTLIKQFVKKMLVGITAFFVNAALYSFFSDLLGVAGREETLYSDGAIRTFDENKVGVVSCVRLDELGCKQTQVVYVNETMNCWTEISIREAGNLQTWIDLAFGNDKCMSVENFQGCPPNSSTCYKNSLSACFRMICTNTNASDQVKAFQYWVGSVGDPVGFDGPFNPKINILTAKRYSDNNIVLEAGPNPKEGGYPAID